MNPALRKNILLFAVFSLAVLLLYLLLWLLVDQDTLVSRLGEIAAKGRLVFLAVAFLAAALSLPRQIIALAAGMTYGWLEGLAMASVAVLAGTAVQFTAARFLLRPFLGRAFSEKRAWMDKASAIAPFRTVLMLRLLPGGQSSLINLAAGSSSIGTAAFISASYLGQLPQNAIFALAGSGLTIDPLFRLSTAGALFAISLGLAAWLYKRYKLTISA